MAKTVALKDIAVAKKSPFLGSLRVAIVHDYLNQQGGAEKVVEVLCRMFPDAPVYTSVYDPDTMGSFWKNVDIRTSFMQKLSSKIGIAKSLLPLYPSAFECFDLAEYDLVISSSSSFAKGVITRPETCHVCYCYTPTRFLWMYHEYTDHQRFGPGVRRLLPVVMSPLRVWDFTAAYRVDHFIAISRTVEARIGKYYRRSSSIVEPPVDIDSYKVADQQEDYFLVVARLLGYKRVDLAIEAANRLRVPLRIAGDGPDRARLQGLAGPTVTFLGRVSDDDARLLLGRCRALVWPGEEDFGLVPVEAQASGRAVIAFNAGGAAETVIDGVTGMHFAPQTVEALAGAMDRFDPAEYDSSALRKNARRYALPQFVKRMTRELETAYAAHVAREPVPVQTLKERASSSR